MYQHFVNIIFYNQRTPADHRWDETPGHKAYPETPGATPGQSTRIWDATPAHQAAATPTHLGSAAGAETPGHGDRSRRNRWDETPKTERGIVINIKFNKLINISLVCCASFMLIFIFLPRDSWS